jgi:Ca2+-binding EF-hand superfamily protein
MTGWRAVAGAALVAGLATAASAQQGARMAERFAALDADGDGAVTAAELGEWREGVFWAMDADGDEALSREEFMAVQMGPGADPDSRGPRFEAMQAQKAAEYDRMDADGDGLVPKADWDAFGATVLSEADSDGDGAMSLPEFRAMHGRP